MLRVEEIEDLSVAQVGVGSENRKGSGDCEVDSLGTHLGIRRGEGQLFIYHTVPVNVQLFEDRVHLLVGLGHNVARDNLGDHQVTRLVLSVLLGTVPPHELPAQVLLRLWQLGLKFEALATHRVGAQVTEEMATEDCSLTHVTQLPCLVHVLLPGWASLVRDLREGN